MTLLRSIYDQFTEGFGTTELIHAEALLEGLLAKSSGRDCQGSIKRSRDLAGGSPSSR